MRKYVRLIIGLTCGMVFSVEAATKDVTIGPMAEKGPGDVPALIKALKAEEMGTRWNAALLLGEIGDKSAVPALIECAGKDDNPRVRRRAIEALGKLGDKSAIPVLTAALQDGDRFVRRDAARALGQLGDKTAVPALSALLKDPEGFVRRDAARALGEIGDTSAIPGLQQLAEESAEAYSADAPLLPEEMSPAAREACFALGKLGGDTAVPALAMVLKHTTSAVRARAAVALGHCGAAAAPVLEGALLDSESNVRRAAIASLKQIGGAASVAALSEAFTLNDVPWSALVVSDLQKAAQALGELGDKSALPVLQSALATARDKNNVQGRSDRLIRDIRAAIHSIEKGKE